MKHYLFTFWILISAMTNLAAQSHGNCNACCSFDVTQYDDCVDFENFVEGDLVPQASPQFTLFNTASLNPKVVKFPTGTNNKCMYIENVADVDYNIERVLTENIAARLEWKMYVQQNKGGAVGLETVDPFSYPLLILLSSDQKGSVFKYQNNGFILLSSFDYQQNVWLKFSIVFNPKEDLFELWLNGRFIHRVTDYKSNKVTDLNIYGDAMTVPNGFYVDDICYRETDPNIACTLESAPVCVQDKSFINGCFAHLEGYTDCEYTVGPCTNATTENEILSPKFYPNPSQIGFFYTAEENLEYHQLLGTNGQRFDIILHDRGIDVRHLMPGVYFLQGRIHQIPFWTKLVLVD